MARRLAALSEVLVVVLLSILMFRVEMVESARILSTSIPSNATPFPPLPPGPDSRSRLGDEEPPPLPESAPPSTGEMEISVPGAGAGTTTTTAGRTYSKLAFAQLRQLFGSMLPRGSKFPPGGIPSETPADRFHKIFGSMLPRGNPSPPAGIPSPIHN